MTAPSLVCPRCHRVLQPGDSSLRCEGCKSEYPIVAGIPDLRVEPDPWIEFEADRAKGVAVDTQAGPGLEAAVRAYWRMTPTTSARDAERHIDHVLHAVPRTREWVEQLVPSARAGEQWLDLGCGTADLACAVPDDVVVTGIDIAFRWLIVARRRLIESGRESSLVCGNAEALPFPAASFDRVVALGTLEHCRDADVVMSEVRRVLRPGGKFHIRSSNRFTLLAEPHVGVWGVGLVPRAWADRYVRWRGGSGYQHHFPRSAGEIGAALRRAGFLQTRVQAAQMLHAERHRIPVPLARLLPVYDLVRQTPVLNRIGRTVAPLLDAEGVAP